MYRKSAPSGRPAVVGTGALVALTLALTFLHGSDLKADNTRVLLKKPYEVIVESNIRRLETEAAGQQPDCESVIRSATREVSAYTAQFVQDRRIADERRTQRSSLVDLDKNSARLIALLRGKSYAESSFLGEHPYMVRLHTVLGRCYELMDQPYRASSEYAMAFRYMGIEQPFQEIPKDKGDAEREMSWRFMAAGFGDPDRAKQETDPAEKSDAERVQALLREYEDTRVKVEEARKAVDVAASVKARGGTADVVKARQTVADVEQRLETTKQALESIRNGSYKKYHEKKSRTAGILAFRLANLVKKLETENKKTARLLNRSSFYRGVGTGELGEERTELRNFVGYGIFLEFAHKLDPFNKTYVGLLADEYRSSRDLEQAAAFEERYIELASKEGAATPDDAKLKQDLAAHYLKLGGIFTDKKNYILAAKAYEEALSRSVDNDPASSVRLHLADIYFKHTGNFAGAETLLRNALNALDKNDAAALSDRPRTELRTSKYKIASQLASIDRRSRRTEQERADLAKARTEFMAVEADYKLLEKAADNIQTQILALKRQLLNQEDDNLQKDYYKLLRIDLPQAKSNADFLRVRLNALNLPVVLERLAVLALRDRNFEGARDLYREIVTRGNGDQGTRARQNVERINLTLADGLLRDPVLPTDFER
ncbi:MAG: hypothetical protein HY042_02380 [Spirochaetia bacterium]|nr:hypothetical protein [Spirochaetia bacterium]